MKTYVFVTRQKKETAMYRPYLDLLADKFDQTDQLADADIVLILGAWSMKAARLAKKSRQMGIPYLMVPLGDLSPRNRQTPGLRRSMQTLFYQKKMLRQAQLVIATTPMERTQLQALKWTQRIVLVRYCAYSQLTSYNEMADKLTEDGTETLKAHEEQKAARIASQTEAPIVRQVLQIESRMPHCNIPQNYLDALHALLYEDNYNEDQLRREFQRLKLVPFAAAVFQVMSEKTGLTEGFMPLPGKKSSKSREILRYVK